MEGKAEDGRAGRTCWRCISDWYLTDEDMKMSLEFKRTKME